MAPRAYCPGLCFRTTGLRRRPERREIHFLRRTGAEDQLDRPVFIRNKAGARLTPAGEQFLRFATTLVQVWDRARRSVALPPGRETVVTIGVELSLWSPLLRHWLLWMRRECPEIAVRTTPTTQPLEPADHVEIDWGEEFAASYQAAFPDRSKAVVSISYGPLALDYLLATGGSGYFREGFVRSYIDEGRLALVPDSPEFSYSAYVVHSAKADPGVMARIRTGLRAAAKVRA